MNLLREPSRNYAEVQDEVAGAVLRHLPSEAVTSSQGERREGHVNLTLFIRRPGDVLLSHGVADKSYLFIRGEDGERLVNGFQHVLVPGAWQRDRLLGAPSVTLTPDRIHVVGWPRLDTLLEQQAEQRGWDTDATRRRPRVLWAPTHDRRKRGPDQRSSSSYPELEADVPAIAEHAEVAVSLHPSNRKDKRPTGSQLLWADVVISDFGTMVYEAWALGKPVIFPRWIFGDHVVEHLPRAAEGHIHRERIGLHADSLGELLEMVGSRAPLGDDVTRFMADYLDPTTYGRAGRLAAHVLDALRRGIPPAEVPSWSLRHRWRWRG